MKSMLSLGCALLLSSSVAAIAQDQAQTEEAGAAVELPGQLSWTAYDLGSAGYNQAVAIGAALKNAYGTNLRVLPGKNDIARAEPLRQGRVDFSATGIGGAYMAQEGAFEFGAENWGPQSVRLLMANSGGEIGLSVGVAAAVCEEVGKPDCEGFTYADLKGRNIAYVQGAPALNVNMEAYLAYGGLTWDDVNRVDFGGFGDSWDALGSGQADAAFASTNSGKAYEQETNPRGLVWPPIDPEDTEAVERMQAIAPFLEPVTATVGATIDGTDGTPTAGYPYPILLAMDEQEADLVYAMTKAMDEQFDNYTGKAPGIDGWSIDNQNLSWVVPYHEGAIRYYEELGQWSPEAQEHNDELIERQEVLQTAWQELTEEGPDDWETAWNEKRKQALSDAGMNVVF